MYQKIFFFFVYSLAYLLKKCLSSNSNGFSPKFISDIQITPKGVNLGNPAISITESEYFIALWSIHSYSSISSGIRGCIYDTSGIFQYDVNISSSYNYLQDHPAVSMQNDGTYMVVWESFLQDGDGFGIYGQLFMFDTPLGNDIQINKKTTGNQKSPSISSSGGYYVITWQGPDDSGGYAIYTKIYDSQGNSYGNEIPINSNSQYDQSKPSVELATLTKGDGKYLYYVITWMGYGQNPSDGYMIYAREFSCIISKNGSVTYDNNTEYIVNTFNSINQGYPSVSLDTNNDDFSYIIVWELNYEVKGRVFSKNGSKSNEFKINSKPYSGESQHLLPYVSLKTSIGFMVVWQLISEDLDGYIIYGQLMALNGSKIGVEFQVNSFAKGDQKFPYVKMNSQNIAIIVWLSENANQLGNGLNFQIYFKESSVYTLNTNGEERSLNTLNCFNIKNPKKFNFKISKDKLFDIIVWIDANINIVQCDKTVGSCQCLSKIASQDRAVLDMAILSKNSFIIVWSNSSNNVYYNIYNDSTIVQLNKLYPGYSPKVLLLTDGSVLISWTCVIENNITEICAKFLNPQMQLQQQFLVSMINNTLQNKSNVSIARGVNNLVLVVWVSVYSEYVAVEGRIFQYTNNNLQPTCPDFQIHQFNNFNSYPIAAVSSRSCLVVWEEISTTSGVDIGGQVIDLNGDKLGQSIYLNQFFDLNEINPSIIVTNNFYFIVWQSFGEDTDGYGIYGRTVDFSGVLLGDEFRINSNYRGDQTYPVIAFNNETLTLDIEVLWINGLGFAAQTYSENYLEDISNVVSPFINSGYLGIQILTKFGKRQDSKTIQFSDDGNYVYIGLSTGIIQIYDINYFTLLTEIDFSDYDIMFMKKNNDFLYVGTSDFDVLFIVNISDIYNPNYTNYSLTNSCEGTNQINESDTILMLIAANRLYFGFHYTLCIYDIQNGTVPIFKGIYNLGYFLMSGISIYEYMIYYGSNDFLVLINTTDFENVNYVSKAQLSSNIIDILITPDAKYLFVSTSDLMYYSIINSFVNDISDTVLAIESAYDLTISPDLNLLAYTSVYANGSIYVGLIDISNFYNPTILSTYIPGKYIYQKRFTKNSNYLILDIQLGITAINIVRSNITKRTPNISITENYNIYLNLTNTWIDLSPTQKTIYTFSSINNVDTVIYQDIKDFGFSYKGDVPDSSQFYLYPISCITCNKKIMIYEVTNETNFYLRSKIVLSGISDYVITNDQNYMFIALYNNNNDNSLLSVNITDKSNPTILYTLWLPINSSPFLAFSYSQDELYLSAGLSGVLIINIINKTNLTILTTLYDISNSKFNFDIFISFHQQNNNYIAVSNKGDSLFAIFQIYSDFSFVKKGSALTLKEIVSIRIFNQYFLAILCQSKSFKIYSIHDLTTPEIVQSQIVFSNKIPSLNATNMVMSSLSNTFYFPFGNHGINVFPDSINDIYGDVTLNPSSGYSISVEFIIKFWILNKQPSTARFKLIDLPNIDSTIKWITEDYNNMQINIFPTNIQDVVNSFQPVNIIYVSSIEPEELTNAEIDFLIRSNYIDNELFITKGFVPNSIQVYDGSDTLSAPQLNYILSQHYYQKSFYFSSNLFLQFIAPPSLNRIIQNQLKQLNNGYTHFLVEQSLDLQLAGDTFSNPTSLSLSYTTQNLPNWLSFDQSTLRFYGTSTFNELNYDYNITLICSNGFQQASDTFLLSMRYYLPKVNANKTLQSQTKSDPQVDVETDYMFAKDSFIDGNNGTLTYDCTLDDIVLPGWITFDASNLILVITPTSDNFLKVYTVKVTAYNNHYKVSDTITFRVQASWHYALTFLSEILAGILSVIGYFKYRSTVYNKLFKKYYCYPEETLMINNLYDRRIYFIEADIDIASVMWLKFIKQPTFQLFMEKDFISKPEFKDKFSKELRNILNELSNDDKLKDIEEDMLEPDGTLFVVCECFYYHYLLSLSFHTNKVYQKMKSSLKKEFSLFWYLELCSLDEYERNFKINKFPKIIINEKKLKSQLTKTTSTFANIKENLIDFHIICAMIKADALGIPRGKRKWYNLLEYSRGESCFLDILSVNELKFSIVEGKSMKDIEVNSTRKLPSWFDYKIKNGVLHLIGTPQFYNQGTFNITIMESEGFILRSQNILIKSAINMSTKNYLEKTTAKEKDKKMFDDEELIQLDRMENEDKKNPVRSEIYFNKMG